MSGLGIGFWPTFVNTMRNHIDISFARFLMIFSLLLLGILEFMWLRNEYNNSYRNMEEKLSHVMFSSMRDVEDSLIFSRLSTFPTNHSGPNSVNKTEPLKFNIVVHTEDSLMTIDNCGYQRKINKADYNFKSRHPVRGMLLQELTADTTGQDTSHVNLGAMVMSRIRLADSTGEYAGYEVISWQSGDTVIREVMSRPQYDVLANKKIALINPNYKADIFGDLLPHMSFALFMWIMVGAAFYYIWKNLRQQIRLNALRDEFVGNITHELKTPITTVGVALESLNISGDLQSAHSRKYLEICRSELNRLSMLVERILHSRSPQLHYEQLDVKLVLEEVMEHMKVQFDKKHADVSFQQQGDGFIINGDKAHMSGVFYNLLDNALKYSTDHPVIKVQLTRNNGTVRFDIADNGIGIDPDYHEKIFEKLYRVPQQNRHDVKGHGLGLSYVADVVKQHHGKIDLVSERGKGSTFTMTIPAWKDSTNMTSRVGEDLTSNTHLN
ncbi:MAG TPA: HAMP domain-containing sensor histidine kinase [Saprospiraceae bacterium]|nr:HAMP domain-containing sensor histidine kinase [Saprospiraceae bacterium]